ncbi:MAG TPA: OB-fold nucleic acid binding domain-containing protein, partial [Anaerolineaceae bacterium]|nr:OB-fold nucleic acid binding domain-containing protein [Anaerolineaceae bacterium]
MYKTHTNGELRAKHINETVTLAGWVNRVRDHGGVRFIDLRDRFGLVQVVVNPTLSEQAYQLSQDLRPEWVIQVKGVVQHRPEGSENPNLPTGEIEVEAQSIRVLNPAKALPFSVNKDE